MAYQLIEDFRNGLDLRRSALSAEPTSLRVLDNGFVNTGGEVEKRQAISEIAVLPANTFGLAYLRKNLYVFGTVAAPAMPNYVQYHRLTRPAGGTIAEILDVVTYGTSFFVTAKWTDGVIRHFYQGTEITTNLGNAQAFTVYTQKVYGVDATNIFFSAVGIPSDFTTAAGSGVIDASEYSAGIDDLIGLAEYYGNIAMFGRSSIQIWAMDPDPAKNSRVQTLGGIGLVAPHALATYGNGDVLFLSETGVRSLRARNSSNAAGLSDVGSPIDRLLRTARNTISAEVRNAVRAFIDPLSGQFWLYFNGTAYVLSDYAGTGVSAWSTFSIPTGLQDAVVAGSRIAFRVGNSARLYGGIPNGVNPFDPASQPGTPIYGSDTVTVITPYYDLNTTGTQKDWTGIDVTCEGEWDVYVNPDPTPRPETAPDGAPPGPDGVVVWQYIGRVGAGATWGQGRIPVEMRSTHMAFKFLSVGSGYHRLSALGLHYALGEAS